MGEGLFSVLGGIGLFLFGMKVMTEALREAAGTGLRRLLVRFTGTVFRGALTGVVATAVVQSSSAVTVMTLGFVGAGLMTFPTSLGVLYGANVGTTVTGWIVAMLGIKLKIGIVALPVLFLASFMFVLGSGRVARIGHGTAGLCLLFIGLDLMQAGVAGIEGILVPEMLPGAGWWGRLQLILMGFVVAFVLQSSSAGIAIVLVLLGGGAISFLQAVALLVGMNVGTTVTGLLASVGATRAVRQAAVANLLFNLVLALISFPLIGLIAPVLHMTPLGSDDQTALVLFHTALKMLGLAMFLPLNTAFAHLVERLVPDRAEGLAAMLEPALLSDENAALDAAQAASGAIADATFSALGAALHAQTDLRLLAALPLRVGPAVDALNRFLARIKVPGDRKDALERYAALLHELDHLSRLLERAQNSGPLAVIETDSLLRRPARLLGASLERAAAGEEVEMTTARLKRIAALIRHRYSRYRRATLLREHAGIVSVAELFQRTDAMRWLEHASEHAWKIAHYRHMASMHAVP